MDGSALFQILAAAAATCLFYLFAVYCLRMQRETAHGTETAIPVPEANAAPVTTLAPVPVQPEIRAAVFPSIPLKTIPLGTQVVLMGDLYCPDNPSVAVYAYDRLIGFLETGEARDDVLRKVLSDDWVRAFIYAVDYDSSLITLSPPLLSQQELV